MRVQRLYVSHGFHSPLMEPVLDAFESAVAGARFSEPRVPVISNVTGRQVEPAELGRPSYWRRHLRDTVRFSDGINTLLEQGYRWFVEMGPHPTLTGIVRQFIDDPQLCWLVSLRRGQADWPQVLEALGALHVAGAPVNWRAFDMPYARRRVSLPTYPFQRQRYWIDAAASRGAGEPNAPGLPGRRVRSPIIRDALFEARVGTAVQPWLSDHRLFGQLVFPATGYVVAALGAAVDVAGDFPIAIEDLALSAPLMLAPGTTYVVQSTLSADGVGAWRFQLFSQVDTPAAQDQWTLHAAGVVRKAQPFEVSAIDVAELRARCPHPVDPAEHYVAQRARGLAFGPAFQGFVTLARGADEALGESRLPDGVADASAGLWHPAFLDCALQTVIQAAGAQCGNDSGILVPIAIDRVTFHAKAPCDDVDACAACGPSPGMGSEPTCRCMTRTVVSSPTFPAWPSNVWRRRRSSVAPGLILPLPGSIAWNGKPTAVSLVNLPVVAHRTSCPLRRSPRRSHRHSSRSDARKICRAIVRCSWRSIDSAPSMSSEGSSTWDGAQWRASTCRRTNSPSGSASRLSIAGSSGGFSRSSRRTVVCGARAAAGGSSRRWLGRMSSGDVTICSADTRTRGCSWSCSAPAESTWRP